MMPVRTIAARMQAALLVGFALISVPAFATPGSGFGLTPVVNGTFGKLNVNTADNKTDKWGMILKTLDETDISSDRLTLQPGGYIGWHAHPAPVFITVTQGSITWYDGSDPLCTATTYSAGESFIEGAYRTHNVVNASNSDTAQFVGIVIKPTGYAGLAFRLDRGEPNNCKF